MRFRLLGPLEVWAGQDWQRVGAEKCGPVLAALLINAGQIVPTDVLISEVWGDQPPAGLADQAISIYMLRLRRLLGDTDGSILVTCVSGYQLRLGTADSDAQVFEAMLRDARQALADGDSEAAVTQVDEALALWRGIPLADIPLTPLVEAEAERLAGLRLEAAELRIEAEMACRGPAQVIPDLQGLLASHPLRERLWLLLMQALDAAGRPAEALGAYSQARSAIADELGAEPGTELRQFYAGLLARDDLRAAGGGDAAAGAPAGADAASPRPATPTRAPAAPQAAMPARCPLSCRWMWRISRAVRIRSGSWPGCCRGVAANPGRTRLTSSASRWCTGRAGWVRRPWPCTPPTGSAAGFPAASCTWTCSAAPPGRSRPPTCWPGSCATSAWTACRSRSARRNARPCTGPGWPGGRCSSCWTTPVTPPRSGRCCPVPRPALCWSPPAAGCLTWPAPRWSTSASWATATRWPCLPGSSAPSGSAPSRRPPPRFCWPVPGFRWPSGSARPGWPSRAACDHPDDGGPAPA